MYKYNLITSCLTSNHIVQCHSEVGIGTLDSGESLSVSMETGISCSQCSADSCSDLYILHTFSSYKKIAIVESQSWLATCNQQCTRRT